MHRVRSPSKNKRRSCNDIHSFGHVAPELSGADETTNWISSRLLFPATPTRDAKQRNQKQDDFVIRRSRQRQETARSRNERTNPPWRSTSPMSLFNCSTRGSPSVSLGLSPALIPSGRRRRRKKKKSETPSKVCVMRKRGLYDADSEPEPRVPPRV